MNISVEFNPKADLVLFNGDCLKILEKIPDEFVKLVVTSPPYNIGKAYEKREKLDKYLDSQRFVGKLVITLTTAKLFRWTFCFILFSMS